MGDPTQAFLKKYQSLLSRKVVFLVLVLIGFVVCGIATVELLIGKTQFPRATFLALLIGLFISLLLQYLRREWMFQTIVDETTASYDGISALLYTYRSLSPRFSLPKTRGWAASPDFLNILIETILIQRPRTVVELGAGTSTVVIAYALEKNQEGKLYSIDHYEEYLDLLKKVITRHGLCDRVALIHAPFTKTLINGNSWTYYASESLNVPGDIDMLVIDGPPSSVQSNARYPAIPLLFNRLSPGAMILVDDYKRPDDRKTVQLWLKEYPKLSLVEESFTEKGTAVLMKSS
jgi:predicted O-methyltransferase YrrM